MLRSILLVLAGILIGANVTYFLMTRAAPRRSAAPPPAPVAETTRPAAVPASPAATAPAAESTVTASPAAPRDLPAAAAAPPSAAGMLLPVQGVRAADLRDTFNEMRDGVRIHEALDIMAARGTPVLAAVDGKVEKLFTSKAGGLTIYEFDRDATHAYYYAHLDRYADGLREGQALKRGQLIGYVGSTGNASADAPHLHFAIFTLGPEKQWWKGSPVDPYPLLTRR